MIGWNPWANRNSEPEERIHDYLTDDAREKVAYALNRVASRGEIQEAYQEYRVARGEDFDYFNTKNRDPASASLYTFVTQEDDEEVLTLLELLINELWTKSSHSRERHSAEELVDLDETLRQILLEEGILYKLTPDRETVYEFAQGIQKARSSKSRYRKSYAQRPSRNWMFEFEKLAHGAVVESDQAVRQLGRQERWEDALSPYNDAWEAYQNPPVSNIVAEKLYNSLEMTLEKICVEEQGWTSEGAGVAAHIDALKDNGMFAPNQSMVHEWTQLTEGLKAGVQKTGGDRTGHEEMDEEYALLLLHQVGAFLSFVISRYEAEYVD